MLPEHFALGKIMSTLANTGKKSDHSIHSDSRALPLQALQQHTFTIVYVDKRISFIIEHNELVG